MEKMAKSVDPQNVTLPAADAMTFAASWDVFYQDAQGLECHLQLKGETLDALLDLARGASMAIIEAGGKPSRRMGGHAANGDKDGSKGNDNGAKGDNGTSREPTYVDERGVRRCNRKLTDDSVCGRQVTEREGRYGAFWSCPNYKSHAPAASR